MTTVYPILLVHGIVFKDSRIFKAFGKIGKKLKESGLRVYVSRQDGFGKIESNAAQLKTQIHDILNKENAKKINLIAHSKGGLDCKYLIKELGMEDKVTSLTTLCTPHRGSPVASRIMKLPKPVLKFVAFWINFWYKIFGDEHPDSYGVCKELQRQDGVEEGAFSDKVYCQSFSATMDRAKDDFIMSVPLAFSRRLESGDTDGLVPADSAKFANYRGSFNGSISHSQIAGFMVPEKKKEKVYSFYLDVCKELADMNF
ncbi:MAG: hypothetical protein K2G96_02790 [Clostridia bacterium]|nr:hypothetical protein [Clostridia bacterium]